MNGHTLAASADNYKRTAARPLRVIFAGTPDFAAHHLQALIDSQHQLVSVYTQPDRPSGRGKKITASPVKQLAQRYRLPVYQPVSLKDADAQRQLSHQGADVMVVVAYGLILPQAVLQAPRYGCINVHASLLPRWRGAAPIQRALAAGDSCTGITIMQMDAGLDTGPMLSTSRCAIEDTDTSASLQDKLLILGPPALLEVLDSMHECRLQSQSTPKLTLTPQDDNLATYAIKISKREAMICWSSPAAVITRLIRAFYPFPIAYTSYDNDRVKVYKAETQPLHLSSPKTPGEILKIDNEGILVACGEGTVNDAVNIVRLQLPGKKIMSVPELLNGYPARFAVGRCFQANTVDKCGS